MTVSQTTEPKEKWCNCDQRTVCQSFMITSGKEAAKQSESCCELKDRLTSMNDKMGLQSNPDGYYKIRKPNNR